MIGTPLLTETEARVLRALFRTGSRDHSRLAVFSGFTEAIVGGAIMRLHRKGFVQVGHGAVRPLRTLTGARVKQLTPAEEQALVDDAVRKRRVRRCPDSHAMGALTFLPFGGRWFS